VVRVWDVPVGGPGDVQMLRRLAEALGGHRLRSDDILEDPTVEETHAIVADVRARWGDGDALAERFVRWFLADPADRAVSPLSTARARREGLGTPTARAAAGSPPGLTPAGEPHTERVGPHEDDLAPQACGAQER
jgi:hypothetical protein